MGIIRIIDQVVSAEIPDCNDNPVLYEREKRHMMHGPCGALNPHSAFVDAGICSKKIPRGCCFPIQDSVNDPKYKNLIMEE